MKKLIMIGAFPPPYYGSNISFERVINSDITQYFNIKIIDISDKRNIENVGKFDFKNIIIGLKSIILSFLRTLIFRPDIYYICISQNTLSFIRDGLSILFAKLSCPKTKVIVHLRGSYFKKFYDKSNFINKTFINIIFKLVSDSIVLGENLRDIFLKWIPKENIHVVPNGTNINCNEIQKDFINLKNESINVAFLSTIVPSKGIFDLIEAIITLNNLGYKINLKIAGEIGKSDPASNLKSYEIKEKFYDFLKDGKYKNSLKYYGILKGKDKINLLLESQILALPTYYPYEGLPNAILEGMACGCTIISTNHAAIPEVVINNINGFIINSNNQKEICESIIKLYNDRDLLEKMMKASFLRYKSFYTAKISNDNLINTFKKIADKKK